MPGGIFQVDHSGKTFQVKGRAHAKTRRQKRACGEGKDQEVTDLGGAARSSTDEAEELAFCLLLSFLGSTPKQQLQYGGRNVCEGKACCVMVKGRTWRLS